MPHADLIGSPVSFPLALGMPHGPEWLVIVAIALLFFGKRVPALARSVGRGILEFKQGLKGA